MNSVLKQVMQQIAMIFSALYWVIFALWTWLPISHDEFHPTMVYVSAATLFVLLVAAQWKVKQPTKALWIVAVIAITAAFLAHPSTSIDYMHFLFDGAFIRFQHLSPFVVPPLDLPLNQYSQYFAHIWWANDTSPYGPLWQWVEIAINIVSFNTITGGLVGLKLLNLAGLTLAARLLWKITQDKRVSLLFLLNPLVLMHTIQTPHADLWIAVLVLWALQYHTRLTGTGAIVLAACIKIHGVIFVPFFITKKHLIRDVNIIAVLGLFIIGGLQLLTPFTLTQMLKANLLGSNPGNSSLLMHTFLPASVHPTVVFAISLLCTAILSVAIFYFWRKGRLSLHLSVALVALLIPLLLTGLLYPWHWLIPLTLMHSIKPRFRLWTILTITCGGIIGPLPAVAMVGTALIASCVFVAAEKKYPTFLQRFRAS